MRIRRAGLFSSGLQVCGERIPENFRKLYGMRRPRMLKKSVLIILVMTLLVTSGAMIGCGKASIPGKYVNQDNPGEYLELNEYGTFYLKKSDLSLDGEWEAEGNELRLNLMGTVATAEIKGNRIIDQDGEVWVKQQ
jgi:hypothetical protein